MTYNSEENIKIGLKNLKRFLKKNGLYVGLDWWSFKHSDSKKEIITSKNLLLKVILQGFQEFF